MENEYDIDSTIKYIIDRHNKFINFMSSINKLFLTFKKQLI